MNDSHVESSFQGGRRLNAVALQNAVLRAECDVVSDSPHDTCLVCGSRSLFNIARMFGGNVPKDRASLIVRESLEMKRRDSVLAFPRPHRLRRKATLIVANTLVAPRDNVTDEVEGRVLFRPQG